MNKVTVEFKYDVGEKVWFLMGNRAAWEVINQIDFEFTIDGDVFRGENSDPINSYLSTPPVRYTVGSNYFIEEKDLFGSREELIASL